MPWCSPGSPSHETIPPGLYAYDLGINAISMYHHGSHELMLQYEFGYRIRARDSRYF